MVVNVDTECISSCAEVVKIEDIENDVIVTIIPTSGGFLIHSDSKVKVANSHCIAAMSIVKD
jgi:hypothetical protein